MIKNLSSGPFCKWQLPAKRDKMESERQVKHMRNLKKIGAAAAGLAGAGAAAMLAKKAVEEKRASGRKALPDTGDYRNTERGMHEKNSKGIYYSSGNYQAFARPKKPEST